MSFFSRQPLGGAGRPGCSPPAGNIRLTPGAVPHRRWGTRQGVGKGWGIDPHLCTGSDPGSRLPARPSCRGTPGLTRCFARLSSRPSRWRTRPAAPASQPRQRHSPTSHPNQHALVPPSRHVRSPRPAPCRRPPAVPAVLACLPRNLSVVPSKDFRPYTVGIRGHTCPWGGEGARSAAGMCVLGSALACGFVLLPRLCRVPEDHRRRRLAPTRPVHRRWPSATSATPPPSPRRRSRSPLRYVEAGEPSHLGTISDGGPSGPGDGVAGRQAALDP
jgi:hypothetical protein